MRPRLRRRKQPVARPGNPVYPRAEDAPRLLEHGGGRPQLCARVRAREGLLLHARAVPAVQESTLRQGLSDQSDVAGTGRHHGGGLRLVHRLPVLRGCLSLLCPTVQLDQAEDSQGTAQPEHVLPWQPAPQAGGHGEMPLLHSTQARGQVSGLSGGLPRRRAQVRQHPRSEQRGVLYPEDQTRFHSTQGRTGDLSALFLLLRRMIQACRNYFTFLWRCARVAFVGDWRYYAWMGFLSLIVLLGINAWARQLVHGLFVTGMSDQVSWGVYIANFTFMVGVAAAAAMLVIPVYIYKNQELHDLVIFGELLAVAAILMCLAFVTVDLGRPDRFWHLIPGIGKFNFPGSMLSWDVIVLNGYLLLNVHICGYLLYCRYVGRRPATWFYIPFVFVAIVWAVSIHTVTAFLYVGLGGRPFWNSSIVGPRFLASAFTAGPALIILALQIIRRVTDYRISDRALLTLRSIVQVSMLINVFLLINEGFKEFYSGTAHVASSSYLYFGLHGHHALVVWIWVAIVFNLVSRFLLVLPLL